MFHNPYVSGIKVTGRTKLNLGKQFGISCLNNEKADVIIIIREEKSPSCPVRLPTWDEYFQLYRIYLISKTPI